MTDDEIKAILATIEDILTHDTGKPLTVVRTQGNSLQTFFDLLQVEQAEIKLLKD